MTKLGFKEFVEKLHLYYGEKITVDNEVVHEIHEPLPHWAKFFVRVGLLLADRYNLVGTRESLVISVPCRDLAVSLITFGIIKGYSDSLENSGLETHYKNLVLLPEGTSLYYREDNYIKPAKYCGTEPSTGRIIIQVQKANSGNYKLPTFTKKYLRKDDCNRLTLSEEEVKLPSSPNTRGRMIATNPLFLEAVLENKSRDDYVSNLEPQAVVLGSLTQLNEEMKKQKFSIGDRKITGCLDDLIMMRTRSIRGSSYGAYIASGDGDGSDRLTKLPDLQKVPYVIFDSSISFLRWRRAWLRSNWIVVLSSKEASYQEAVVSVNEHIGKAGPSGLIEELVQCDIPSGVEIISFTRP